MRQISHVAAIQVEVGRGEIGVLKLGFYGNEAPASVRQLIEFLSETGLSTTAEQQQQQQQSMSSSIGSTQQAVSLTTGGVVTGIVPGQLVELGVPKQSNAYAKSRGKPKAGDNFRPQPRPPPLVGGCRGEVARRGRTRVGARPGAGMGRHGL